MAAPAHTCNLDRNLMVVVQAETGKRTEQKRREGRNCHAAEETISRNNTGLAEGMRLSGRKSASHLG